SRRQQRPLAAFVTWLSAALLAAGSPARSGRSILRCVRRWWPTRVRGVFAQPAPQLDILGLEHSDSRGLLLDSRRLLLGLREQDLDLAFWARDPLVGEAHPYLRSQPIDQVDPLASGEIRTPPRERLPFLRRRPNCSGNPHRPYTPRPLDD